MGIADFQQHAETAKADLLEQFKGKPNIEGLLEVVAQQANEIDAAAVDLITERTVDTAIGAQLDQLAGVVDIERGSSDDTELRARIKAEIRLNRSAGTIEDILEVLTLVLGTSGLLDIAEYSPASLVVYVAPTTVGEILADLIERTRAAGVGGQLVYSESAASGVFTFAAGDTLVSSTTQGFASGDSQDTGTGGVLAGVLGA